MRTAKHGRQLHEDEFQKQAKRMKFLSHPLASKKDKTYTKKALEEIQARRRLRYDDLLNSARNDDMAALIMFPDPDEYEIPLSRVSYSFKEKAELLDIWHYLKKRKKENLPFDLSLRSFGPALGLAISKDAISKMLRKEPEVYFHS